ncbi:sensor histidine kinase [Rossellomorea marisflavi]|uniref:cache domain-containing sensor histidine kinase n=1 Tax=Rossellomorea marisflavi TaxID=189381 RepID=UPI00203A6DCA|nr:sensor histidine kinase [Rossellomorea marisflavi]MCM2591680.1 sensor histidine kinase [Rossellomorea marisflavi]
MLKGSIRNKLIFLLMITTILPFGSSIIVTYLYTKDSMEDQVVKESSNLLYQGKVNLEGYIGELNDLSLSLYNNPDFINYMKSPDKDHGYLTIGMVKNVMQTILYTGDTINGVKISFLEEDRFISATRRTNVVFSRGIPEEDEVSFLKAAQSPFNMYIEPAYSQQEEKIRRSKEIVTIHRAFRNIPDNDVLAYISLDIAPDKVIDLSRNMYNSESEEFYVLSPHGDMIYSSDAEISDKQQWIQEVIGEEKEAGTIEWKRDDFNGVIMYDRLSPSAGGWFLVKRVAYADLYESAFNVAKINILFGVIGLGLVVLATLFVSFRITSPIRGLLKSIQQVESGNMQVKAETYSEDEIGVLSRRFHQMVDRINHLINREYKLELENRTSQLKMLQSQINPHFLYNALQSIGTLGLKNHVPHIYSLVTHLSKIMRYGMDMQEDVVPLHKEITYATAYLLLQKERFGDQLRYDILVHEDVKEVAVPKMILQPIIENYFKHGFDVRNGAGVITLDCRREEGQLIIIVKDNGGGIPEKRLEEIEKQLYNPSKKTEGHIGLKNVYVRLDLYYGGKAALLLKNLDEEGFMVRIEVPLQWEGDADESHHRG